MFVKQAINQKNYFGSQKTFDKSKQTPRHGAWY